MNTIQTFDIEISIVNTSVKNVLEIFNEIIFENLRGMCFGLKKVEKKNIILFFQF